MPKKAPKKKYLSAKELGVKAKTRKYLIYAAKTLPTLSTPQKLNGKTFGFDMSCVLNEPSWGPLFDFDGNECGTVGCILGLMNYKARLDGASRRERWDFDEPGLSRLFYPFIPGGLHQITNNRAAKTTERFLTTGKISWRK